MAADEETKMDFILKGYFFISVTRETEKNRFVELHLRLFQSLTEMNQRDTKAAWPELHGYDPDSDTLDSKP